MLEGLPKRRGRGPQKHVRSNDPKITKARKAWDQGQERKREGVSRRTADAQIRTPDEQLARLDRRLGAGSGASRERRRLEAAISSQRGSQRVVEAVTSATSAGGRVQEVKAAVETPAKKPKLTKEQKLAKKAAHYQALAEAQKS